MKPLPDRFIHISADMVASFWETFDEMRQIDQETAVGVWLHMTLQFFGIMNPNCRQGYHEIMGRVLQQMRGTVFEDLLDVTTFINNVRLDDMITYTWASSACPCPECSRKKNETQNNAI